ncbi:hypothetical protein HY408_00145 [Candidatus Gottesmanbacteria bacterium]|nr:hypothetical protein [Candidatus Gottesmanbacteria bacterium]
MKIHFVCTGNTYRSRLAEAYLKSKKIKNLEVSSSGIEAHRNFNGPITWYAARLLKRHGIIEFASHTWTQTTKELLKTADVIVFMDAKHHEHITKQLQHKPKIYHIWQIPDLDDLGFRGDATSSADDLERIEVTEKTFGEIKKCVDLLIKELSKL